MPDLTLYQRDIEALAVACKFQRDAIYARATKMIVPEEDYNNIKQLENLRDKLHERLRQGLHP